ncbi:MAG: ATP-dependent zinc metalloprotease FtsH [Beduini sp.]|uniref:ATP-dependent zinc metalloprotease FtsH n=1 Tax=Beduini sp. TaxID=1922300 RepID=UPI003990C649
MKSKPTSLIKTILPWLLLLILIGAAYTMLNPSTSKTLTTSEYEALVESGTKIEEAEITPSDLVISMTGVYKEDGKPVKFSVTLPNTETQMNELQAALAASGTLYTVRDASGDGMFMSVIMTFLPTILLIGVMFFMMTKIGGGGGNAKAFEFGNSRAKLEKDQKTRFTDVAGADEEKEELKELVEFLKNPKKFAAMGAKIPKGVLLVGPPGTGKTLLARAVSGEANVPFFSISGSEFVEMFVGVGAGRVRDMFKKAKENAPCIIFIDEIDAVGRQRGSGIGGGHDEREQTLNQLLVEMDGFAGNEGIIILAATNRADVLDPALLRPGRFDRQIQVANPDKRARAQILQVHARNKKFAADVNFDNIAARTPGFSGAELQNVLNEAALLAVRLGRDVITMDDIDEGIDRVIGGPAKKSRKYTEKERKLVAYHEAGHAIIGLTLEDANKVQKVTIIPRGNAGGYNLMTPKEETYFQTKSQLEASITGFMGGRVAEEIFFGDVSSGAQNDIEQATRLARLMVTELGMSELGPIKYGSGQDSVFLGRDYTSTNNDHSGQVAFEIDQQVRKIIDECYKECTRIINENKDKLELIAAALLEYETLANEQIEALYTTGKMPEVSGKTANGTDVILPVEITFGDQEEEKKAEESETAPAEEPRVRKPVSYEDLDDLIDDMK